MSGTNRPWLIWGKRAIGLLFLLGSPEETRSRAGQWGSAGPNKLTASINEKKYLLLVSDEIVSYRSILLPKAIVYIPIPPGT